MSAPKVQAVNCSSFLPVIFLKASAKWSNDQIILCVAPNASLKCIVDEAKPDPPRARNRRDRLHRASAKYGYKRRFCKTYSPNVLLSYCENHQSRGGI